MLGKRVCCEKAQMASGGGGGVLPGIFGVSAEVECVAADDDEVRKKTSM